MSEEFKGKISAILEQAEQDRQRRAELEQEQAQKQAALLAKERRIVEEVWRPVLTDAVELLTSRGWDARLSNAPSRSAGDLTVGLHLAVGSKYSITYRPGSRELKGSRGSTGTGMVLIERREDFEADVLNALKDLTGE